MPSFVHTMSALKYIDIGLHQLVKTSLDLKSRTSAQVKQCCFREACTKGVATTMRDDHQHQFKAPECDAGQQAHAARMNLRTHSFLATAAKKPKKDENAGLLYGVTYLKRWFRLSVFSACDT